MRRTDGGPAPGVVVAIASAVGGAVAYLDLIGTDPTPFGDVSLFSQLAVVAFLVPLGTLLRRRWNRWLHKATWHRWPDVVLAGAGTALTCDVTAHVIGEGAAVGLVAAALAAVAIAFATLRLRA